MGLTELLLSVNAQKEPFSDEPTNPAKDYMWATVAAMVIYVVLIAFVGKFLWNNYLAKYITAVQPLKSPVDILAICTLMALIFPRV